MRLGCREDLAFFSISRAGRCQNCCTILSIFMISIFYCHVTVQHRSSLHRACPGRAHAEGKPHRLAHGVVLPDCQTSPRAFQKDDARLLIACGSKMFEFEVCDKECGNPKIFKADPDARLCPTCCRTAAGRLHVIFIRDPVARHESACFDTCHFALA